MLRHDAVDEQSAAQIPSSRIALLEARRRGRGNWAKYGNNPGVVSANEHTEREGTSANKCLQVPTAGVPLRRRALSGQVCCRGKPERVLVPEQILFSRGTPPPGSTPPRPLCTIYLDCWWSGFIFFHWKIFKPSSQPARNCLQRAVNQSSAVPRSEAVPAGLSERGGGS